MNDATTYDALLEQGYSIPEPCPVCTGHEDAAPCSEECERLVNECAARRRIKRLYSFAHISLNLARLYRATGLPLDHRTVDCLVAICNYRESIKEIRLSLAVR